jgi:hypothetical protein
MSPLNSSDNRQESQEGWRNLSMCAPAILRYRAAAANGRGAVI